MKISTSEKLAVAIETINDLLPEILVEMIRLEDRSNRAELTRTAISMLNKTVQLMRQVEGEVTKFEEDSLTVKTIKETRSMKIIETEIKNARDGAITLNEGDAASFHFYRPPMSITVQKEMFGWKEEFEMWIPVTIEGHLNGRDPYSIIVWDCIRRLRNHLMNELVGEKMLLPDEEFAREMNKWKMTIGMEEGIVEGEYEGKPFRYVLPV